MLLYIHQLLFALLVFSSAVSFSVYLLRRDKLFSYISVYFIFTAIIELCLYDVEVAGPVTVFLRDTMGPANLFISISYFLCTIIITFLVEEITAFKLSLLSFIPSLLILIWFIIWQMLPPSPFHGWLYILPYQLFTGSISLFAINRLKKYHATDRMELWLLRLTSLFSLVIFAEDSFFTFISPILKRRSYSECILWLVYSILAIKRSFKILISLQSAPLAPVDSVYNRIHADQTIHSIDGSDKLKAFGYSVNLTTRELELLPLLLDNKSYQEISEMLYISVGTVKAHNHSIYYKANVKSRSELISCYNSFQI